MTWPSQWRPLKGLSDAMHVIEMLQIFDYLPPTLSDYPKVCNRTVISIVETAQRLKGKGVVLQPTKSAAGRRGIALDKDTVRVLQVHRADQAEYRLKVGSVYDNHDLVFPGATGKPLDPSVLTRNFEKLVGNVGLKGMRLHDLRHGHAAGLIRANVHPRVVQDRLGHASAAFTMQVYGHVSADLQVDAAEAYARAINLG
jgi:integrase